MSAIPINQLFNYVNEARTNPKKFSEYIKKQMDSFIDEESLPLKPNCNYSTNEGKSVWKEAYDHMRNQKPLPPYELNEGLNLSAMDHALDMKNNNFFGHTSSNGMSFSQRIQRRCGVVYGASAENLGSDFDLPGRNHALQTIMGLIIDDGVANRGHRVNLLSTQYKYCGIYAIKADERFETCIKFHSENVKLISNSKQPLTEYAKSAKGSQLSRNNDNDFDKQFSNMKMNQPKGNGKTPSSLTLKSNVGERTIKSKSTSTKTYKKNGKTEKIVTIKIVYSDGSIEQQINEEYD